MRASLGRVVVFSVFIFSIAFTAGNTFALSIPEFFKEKVPLLKVDPWTIKCGTVRNLVSKKLTKFEENKNKHYKIYIELASRLSEKMDNWDDQGLDTTELKADLKVLKEKIAKFEADYTSYKSKLEALKDIDCDKTLTDYNNILKDARTALKLVRKDVVDVRNHYWTEVRPDIVDLKKQLNSHEGE